MTDFSHFLQTDPKYYFLVRSKLVGGPTGYAIFYIKGGCLGSTLIEDNGTATEYERWLLERGANVIDSMDEIDWDINPSEVCPPPGEALYLVDEAKHLIDCNETNTKRGQVQY